MLATSKANRPSLDQPSNSCLGGPVGCIWRQNGLGLVLLARGAKPFLCQQKLSQARWMVTEGVHHTSASTFQNNPRTKFPPWWGQSSKSDSDLRDNICVYEDSHPSQWLLWWQPWHLEKAFSGRSLASSRNLIRQKGLKDLSSPLWHPQRSSIRTDH